MKRLLLPAFLGLVLAPFFSKAQPVVAIDVPQLLAVLPPLPASPAEAHQRVHHNGQRLGAETFYQPWQARLQALAATLQQQQAQFYQQYPTGVRPAAAPAQRVSAGDQAAMNNAMAEFVQKMQSDPAFAQAFSQKSEVEQQAYVQQLLAKNGLQAAVGQPNMPQPDEEPVNWAELTTTLNTEWAAYFPPHSISALLAQAEQQHALLTQQANAEWEKVPLIEMGEYGHDRDPQQVADLRQKALAQHRALAARTLQEGQLLLDQTLARFIELTAAYQGALQQVNFGEGYDFGIFYPSVLGEQMWLLTQLDQLGREAVLLTDHVAYWEGQE